MLDRNSSQYHTSAVKQITVSLCSNLHFIAYVEATIKSPISAKIAHPDVLLPAPTVGLGFQPESPVPSGPKPQHLTSSDASSAQVEMNPALMAVTSAQKQEVRLTFILYAV